jgi:hypothetical protein
VVFFFLHLWPLWILLIDRESRIIHRCHRGKHGARGEVV